MFFEFLEVTVLKDTFYIRLDCCLAWNDTWQWLNLKWDADWKVFRKIELSPSLDWKNMTTYF